MIAIQLNQTENNLPAEMKKIIHDLCSPLSALKNLCSESRDLSDKDKPLIGSIAGRIERIMASMDNKIAAENVEINVQATIIKILLEKKVEYRFCDVEFIYIPTPETANIVIQGNVGDFERMLSNLINNAVEACSGSPGTIKLDLECQNNRLCLTVGDNGKGIPDNVLQKLRSGDTITHGKEKGQGIGFAQIRNTVTKLNGKLDIESKLDAGTKISIQFELCK